MAAIGKKYFTYCSPHSTRLPRQRNRKEEHAMASTAAGQHGDVPEQVGVAVISAPARTGMAGDDSLAFQRLTVPLG